MENVAQVQEKPPVLKSFPKPKTIKETLFIVLGSLLVVVMGIATGWLLSRKAVGKEAVNGVSKVAPGAQKGAQEAGLSDEATFRDSAEGALLEGGIEGEGTHHLDRGLGEDKFVYLTSTVIDLQGFVDRKVKVWGETIKGKKAGWLMDVGKIKVVE